MLRTLIENDCAFDELDTIQVMSGSSTNQTNRQPPTADVPVLCSLEAGPVEQPNELIKRIEYNPPHPNRERYIAYHAGTPVGLTPLT